MPFWRVSYSGLVLEVTMQVTLKIFRFNPEKDKKPHYETYKVDAEPTDRVLDLLEYIKGYYDGSLSFRHVRIGCHAN